MTPDQAAGAEPKDTRPGAPASRGRRRLLQGSAAAAPAILTLVSTPVRATYYTSPASAFASINTSRPDSSHVTNGCKPSWWKDRPMSDWPAACKNASGTSAKFKDCFGTGSTYDDMTLLTCLNFTAETGTDGLVKYLCAAYLNAASGKTPATLCSMGFAQTMWKDYRSKGYYEPTAGIQWRSDSCTPSGNGGCTPWLKTTMPY